jgi:hypothetical protein
MGYAQDPAIKTSPGQYTMGPDYRGLGVRLIADVRLIALILAQLTIDREKAFFFCKSKVKGYIIEF